MRRIDRTIAGKARVLADFEGDWQLERRIVQAGAPAATFQGHAVWRPEGEGLQYVETGVLTLAGQPPMHSERQYFWAPDMSVYFDDGRFFHKVPASGGETGHWCDPDQYDVRYDFAAWPDFRTIWRVRGPKKDYEMISAYQKQG